MRPTPSSATETAGPVPQHPLETAPLATVVARNSLFGLLGLAIDKAVFLLIVLFVARYLGPAGFGRYAFVTAYVAIFQFVADMGVEMILVRRISQRPAERDRLLANGFGMRLCLSAAAWLAAAALVPAVADRSYVELTLIGGGSLLGNTWMAYKALYRSLMKIEYLLLLWAFNATAAAAGVAIAIAMGWGVEGALAGIAAGSIACFPLSVAVSWRHFRFRLRCELRLWGALFREALPLGLNAVLVSISLRVGPLLLIRLRGPTEVAFFSAAAKIVEALSLLPEIPMLTIFPAMAAVCREAPSELARLNRAATKWIVVLLVPAILAAGSLAGPVLTLLYGDAFAGSHPVFRILVWATLFNATGVVWTGTLTALGLQRALLSFYALATAVHVLLGLALIPPLGASGAAMAAVGAAAVAQACIAWFPRAASFIRPACPGALGAAGIGAAIAWLVPSAPVPPVPATLLALGAYAAAVLATGIIGPEERALARRLLYMASGGRAAG